MVANGRIVLPVEVGSAVLALDATRVRAVLGATDIVIIPGGPEGLVGVVPWSGRAVAVLDLAPLLGQAHAPRRARTVLVEAEDAVLALPVDRVREPCPVAGAAPAHVSRVAYAAHEVEVEGHTLPLFAVEELVRRLAGAEA